MPKRNRKKEHYDSFLTINNEQLEINSTDTLGVYPIIIEKMVEQLDICITIHKRVLVVRFDLHLREYSDDNHIISTFMTRQKQRIKRTYKTKDIGSVWVREVEKAKIQHYHCALYIDGDVIQHPRKLLQQIKAKWFNNGHCHIPENCFYYIDKKNIEEERARAIDRLSYLAKVRGKGYRSSQAKDYQTSRLKLN
jgi:hypothetical protein